MLTLRQRAELFNKTDNKVWFTTTGCSQIFTNDLMAHGGSSNVVLGMYCPYNIAYLTDLLGYVPVKCVSKETSVDMCKKSYTKFKLFFTDIVVACTASLCKNTDEREGRFNGAYITVMQKDTIISTKVDYTEYYASNRYIQESLLADDILTALFNFVGIEE